MQPFQTAGQTEMGGTHSRSPLVLVVEDQLAIRDMLSWVLRLQGYQPVCLANGQEALEWIKHALPLHRIPAVILLDLLMPVMDGRSFLTSLYEHWDLAQPVPPIILLTVDRIHCVNLEGYDVLIKPFHINELVEHLRLALAGSPHPFQE